MEAEKKLIGKVTHFFTNINVALIELSDTLKVGEELSFEGSTSNFQQKIESMQIDRKDVPEAKAGDAVGVRVKERVRPGDQVFRL